MSASAATGHAPQGALGERESAILDFERAWWRCESPKEQGIRERFGMGAEEYYRALGRLIDSDAALERDPQLIRRLRRMRATRRRERRLHHDGPQFR